MVIRTFFALYIFFTKTFSHPVAAQGVPMPRVVVEIHSPAMVDLLGSRFTEAADWDVILPEELNVAGRVAG